MKLNTYEKPNHTFHVGLFVLLLLSQSAFADFVIQFDLDQTADGIQSNLLAPSTSFTADIYGTTTGGDSLSSYSISVAFDANELVASNPRHTTPPGFDFTLFTPRLISTSEVRGFSVGTNLVTPPVAGTFLIGSIDFTPVAVDGATDDQDISGFVTLGLDGAFDGPGDPVNVRFEPASVSAVPEPGAGLFMLVAGFVAAVIGRNRWLRKSSTRFP